MYDSRGPRGVITFLPRSLIANGLNPKRWAVTSRLEYPFSDREWVSGQKWRGSRVVPPREAGKQLVLEALAAKINFSVIHTGDSEGGVSMFTDLLCMFR